MSVPTGPSVTKKSHGLWRSCQNRATERGLPFTITPEDIQGILGDRCPALGVRWKTIGPWSPTVDRIFPEVGYIPSNIIIVSLMANQIKSNASLSDIGNVYNFYSEVYRNVRL